MPRTLRDTARYHGLMEGVAAVDSARRIRTVRQAIELAVANAGSPLESKARFLLWQANLPQVESESVQVQVRYSYDGGYVEVDLLINGWLIIETDVEVKYDGKTSGKKTEDVMLDERIREKYLQNLGKVVIRVGLRDLLAPPDGDPCRFIRLVENALENYTTPVRTSRSA